MKRSEMLDILKSNLYHLDPSDPEAIALSKIILNSIEEAGMLPPEYVEERSTRQVHAGLNKIVPVRVLTVKNEWEPEDV